jgi:hypothetical protein
MCLDKMRVAGDTMNTKRAIPEEPDGQLQRSRSLDGAQRNPGSWCQGDGPGFRFASSRLRLLNSDHQLVRACEDEIKKRAVAGITESKT